MRALAIPWAAELERRYRAAATPLAARRYQTLWLRTQGRSVREAAATVGATTDMPRAWIKRGAVEGLDMLAGHKPDSGGQHKMTTAQRAGMVRRQLVSQVWALVRRGGGRREPNLSRPHCV